MGDNRCLIAIKHENTYFYEMAGVDAYIAELEAHLAEANEKGKTDNQIHNQNAHEQRLHNQKLQKSIDAITKHLGLDPSNYGDWDTQADSTLHRIDQLNEQLKTAKRDGILWMIREFKAGMRTPYRKIADARPFVYIDKIEDYANTLQESE